VPKKDAEIDELKPEYDFVMMSGGVRGKYATGTNVARFAQIESSRIVARPGAPSAAELIRQDRDER